MRIKNLFVFIPLCVLFIVIFTYDTTVENIDECPQAASPDAKPDELPVGDTFSIVAIDPVTGEVGGAGASCVDISTTYRRGVTFLSDIILNDSGEILGAIHSQAAYRESNQINARNRMLAGDTPQEIITWLNNNDTGNGSAQDRQYGVVDLIGGPGNTPRSAGFTGSTNSDYKNHIVGPNYAIQGNIILNQDVLDDMETAFLNTNGSLADKLMAALQGAKRVGADTRCAPVGKSSLSAFVKVLRPGELSPSLDIYAGNTPNNVDPIDILQLGYDEYVTNQAMVCNNTINSYPYNEGFEAGFGLWSQSPTNEIQWSLNTGTTPSTGTGPQAANEGITYIYTEATGADVGYPEKRAILRSPCFEIPENHSATFNMDYHMLGDDIGTLTVRANNGNGWLPLFAKIESQGNSWLTASIDLTAFSGTTVQLEIDGITGENFAGDIAVDNIELTVVDLTQIFTYDAGTWTPNAPSLVSNLADNYDAITILSGTPTLNGDVEIADVNISSGATLNIGNGNTIEIHGDLDNQGDFNTENGTLNVVGSSAQSFSGNAMTVETLQLNQSGTLSLLTEVSISGVMQLNSGILETNNNLTFLDAYDSATGFHTTGLLDQVNGGTIVGNVNTQRVIPAKRAFRLINSSVTTSTTIRENWQEDGSAVAGFGTHITGNGGSVNGFDNTATNNPSLYTLNLSSQSYEPVANTNVNTLTAGSPYLMLFRGDRTVDLSTNTPTPTTTMLRTAGTLITGSFDVPSVSDIANGSTLIGNPYQAPVDMALALANGSNINSRYYHVYDPTVGTNGAFVAVDTQDNTNSLSFGGGPVVSQANRFLQPHQSAFINTLASGAASLQFTESQKNVAGSGTDVFFTENNNESHIGILLVDAEENTVIDGTKLVFSNEDSNILNAEDAQKTFNLGASISTKLEDQDLSIQRRQTPIETDVIPLNLSNTETGTYSFNIYVDNLNDGVLAYLVDDYLNVTTALSNNTNTTVNFSVDENITASSGSNRFRVVFQDEVLAAADFDLGTELNVFPNPAEDYIEITSQTNLVINSVSIYDLAGKKVLAKTYDDAITEANISLVGLKQSIYLITIDTNQGNIVERLVKK